MEKVEIRGAEGLALDELEAQRAALLPERIEMRHRGGAIDVEEAEAAASSNLGFTP
jgi:hypothetical protein